MRAIAHSTSFIDRDETSRIRLSPICLMHMGCARRTRCCRYASIQTKYSVAKAWLGMKTSACLTSMKLGTITAHLHTTNSSSHITTSSHSTSKPSDLSTSSSSSSSSSSSNYAAEPPSTDIRLASHGPGPSTRTSSSSSYLNFRASQTASLQSSQSISSRRSQTTSSPSPPPSTISTGSHSTSSPPSSSSPTYAVSHGAHREQYASPSTFHSMTHAKSHAHISSPSVDHADKNHAVDSATINRLINGTANNAKELFNSNLASSMQDAANRSRATITPAEDLISYPAFVPLSSNVPTLSNSTGGCDVYGPLCQTGSTVVGFKRRSTIATTTVACSHYLSANAQTVRTNSAAHSSWLRGFGRSPQCSSYAEIIRGSASGSSDFGVLSSCTDDGHKFGATVLPARGFLPPGISMPFGVNESTVHCCGPCAIFIPRVELLYFPEDGDVPCSKTIDTAKPSTITASANSKVAKTSFFVSDGHTFTSPSLYMKIMGTASFKDECGRLGTNVVSSTVAIAQGDMYTVSYDIPIGALLPSGHEASRLRQVAPLNTRDLSCPTWGVTGPIPSDGPKGVRVGEPFFPLLAAPEELMSVDIAWSKCIGNHWPLRFGIFDPPRALTANSFMASSTITSAPEIKSPMPIMAPGPTTTSQPQPAQTPSPDIPQATEFPSHDPAGEVSNSQSDSASGESSGNTNPGGSSPNLIDDNTSGAANSLPNSSKSDPSGNSDSESSTSNTGGSNSGTEGNNPGSEGNNSGSDGSNPAMACGDCGEESNGPGAQGSSAGSESHSADSQNNNTGSQGSNSGSGASNVGSGSNKLESPGGSGAIPHFSGTAYPMASNTHVMTIGPSTYTADKSSCYVLGPGQTLRPGNALTMSGGKIFSLASDGALAVIGSSTQHLSVVSTGAGNVAVAGASAGSGAGADAGAASNGATATFSAHGYAITATPAPSADAFVLNGGGSAFATLTPGGSFTVMGNEVISMGTDSVLEVDGSAVATMPSRTPTGVGAAIATAFNMGLNGTSAGGVPPFTGGQARLRISRCGLCLGAWTGLVALLI